MDGRERRKAERHAVDLDGVLHLSAGRHVSVQIVNIGTLGALLKLTDLEEPLFEGERAVLEHPRLLDGRPQGRSARTQGSIVRVDLDFASQGVARTLALFFDGGPMPEGYET
jgi:hypothetical protein